MNITVVGRGHVGGGLARLWQQKGHQVATLGREGGDATDADVVVVAVPGQVIADALAAVTGLAGQVTIDATNLYGKRDDAFPSLAHQVKSVIGGPTAKAFSTVFASTYDEIERQRAAPSLLFAAEEAARTAVVHLVRDAGFDPVYIGDLTPGARLLEDSSSLTRAIAAEIGGPFFYRYAVPGEL